MCEEVLAICAVQLVFVDSLEQLLLNRRVHCCFRVGHEAFKRLVKSPMAPAQLRNLKESEQAGAFRYWVSNGQDTSALVQMICEQTTKAKDSQVRSIKLL